MELHQRYPCYAHSLSVGDVGRTGRFVPAHSVNAE